MGDAGVDDDLTPPGMLRFLDTAFSLVADTKFLLWNLLTLPSAFQKESCASANVDDDDDDDEEGPTRNVTTFGQSIVDLSDRGWRN
jgi:hypothetical protein